MQPRSNGPVKQPVGLGGVQKETFSLANLPVHMLPQTGSEGVKRRGGG